MTCNVCVKTYNKSTRKKITCDTCQWSACLACNVKYINSHTAQCMNCQIAWGMEFVVSKLSRKLFKNTKKRILLQQEFHLIPETQYYLQYDAHIYECSEELRNLQKNVYTVHTRRIKPKWMIESMKKRIRMLKSRISAWNRQYVLMDQEENVKSTPMFACFMECNGFVMETNWKCGVCLESYCEKCHAPKRSPQPHTCDPSATLIANTSKPCPKCFVLIHKINGCDQMWCTQCACAFSWKTGVVHKLGTPIHNPHYFEYHHFPPYTQVIERCNELRLGCDRWYIMTMHRLNTHILETESRRFDGSRNNIDLRLKWLKNEITESNMANALYRRFKKREINTYRMETLEQFHHKSVELFRRFFQTNDFTIPTEFKTLVMYTNKRFEHLCHIHKLSMPYIDIITIDESGRCVFDIYKHNTFLPMKNYFKSTNV